MKFFILLLSVHSFTASAQTAQEILNKHIEAIGGKAAINAITSFKYESGSNIVYYKQPGNMRIERFENGKLDQHSIIIGQKSWVVFSSGSAEETNNYFFDLILNFLPGYFSLAAAPEFKIEYLQKDAATGNHLISMEPLIGNNFGYSYVVSIDPVTFMITRVEENSMSWTYNIYFEDFTTLNGVKIPTTVIREDGYTDEQRKITRTNIQLNIPLDDKLFEKPVIQE